MDLLTKETLKAYRFKEKEVSDYSLHVQSIYKEVISIYIDHFRYGHTYLRDSLYRQAIIAKFLRKGGFLIHLKGEHANKDLSLIDDLEMMYFDIEIIYDEEPKQPYISEHVFTKMGQEIKVILEGNGVEIMEEFLAKIHCDITKPTHL